MGLLGKNILGRLDFDIEIRLGAGAFQEKDSLLASIEGVVECQSSPSVPPVKGLGMLQLSTTRNLNNIPVIIAKGGTWFNKLYPRQPRTKSSPHGKIRNSGLLRFPWNNLEGYYDIGGGIAHGKSSKQSDRRSLGELSP